VIVRVSLKYTGAETAGRSFQPDIAGDGSAIVFASNADNVVETIDQNEGVTDVFHLALPSDPGDREVAVLSVRGGRQGNGPSTRPSVSDDGRTVAFLSEATNLTVKPDRNRAPDVFVHDVHEPRTARVSVATGGEPANGASFDNHVSGDGNLVAFTTAADNLAFENRDQNGRDDIFVHDRKGPRSKTNRVNIRSGTLDEADGDSSEPVLSEDGGFVAFTSVAADLVPGDTNNVPDVFRYDREARKTIRISLTSQRQPTNAPSGEPSISDDGNRIAFSSRASNLVGVNGAIARSIFLRDVEEGTTTLVSRTFATGGPGDGASSDPDISGDGRYVVFESAASDLVPGDTNGAVDIFVFDLVTERMIRISTGIDGAANGDSFDPAITDDGSYVVFASDASNLVEGDINNQTDIFLRGPLTRPADG
jgi:Tol biopolymer transport system component